MLFVLQATNDEHSAAAAAAAGGDAEAQRDTTVTDNVAESAHEEEQ